MTTAEYFTLQTYGGSDNILDDIVFLEVDGDTWETETFAYNAANELTSQTANGATLTYAYDQYGRMTSKSDGTYSATYTYNYGDKLTKVASMGTGMRWPAMVG